MTVAPRDVHKQNRNGSSEWILNQKSKKSTEISFKKLTEDDQDLFTEAMEKEIDSYLDHEAVAIATMNGISPERLLGMRWVLTWKPIEDDQGKDIGHKAKARLIIKGFQDPDLLHIKRDSPTLATSSRNMILAIASTNQWRETLRLPF